MKKYFIVVILFLFSSNVSAQIHRNVIEADPVFGASLASGITEADTTYWGINYLQLDLDYDTIWDTNSIIVSGSNFAGVGISGDGQYITVADILGQLNVSNDFGQTFVLAGGAGIFWDEVGMSDSGQYQLIGTFSNNLRLSNDYGVTWTPKSTSTNWMRVTVGHDGQNMYALATNTLYESSDFGQTWSSSSEPNILAYAVSNDYSYHLKSIAGAQLELSTDFGSTFNPVGPSGAFTVEMSGDGQYMTAVQYGGFIHVSNDYGVTWNSKGISSSWVDIAISDDGRMQMAADDGVGSYLYVSTDYGETWTQEIGGFTGPFAVDLTNDGLTQIAANYNGNAYVSYASGFLASDYLINYSSDFSTAYANRSLVDKEYVDTQASTSPGNDTEIVFNDTGSFGTNASFTIDGTEMTVPKLNTGTVEPTGLVFDVVTPSGQIYLGDLADNGGSSYLKIDDAANRTDFVNTKVSIDAAFNTENLNVGEYVRVESGIRFGADTPKIEVATKNLNIIAPDGVTSIGDPESDNNGVTLVINDTLPKFRFDNASVGIGIDPSELLHVNTNARIDGELKLAADTPKMLASGSDLGIAVPSGVTTIGDYEDDNNSTKLVVDDVNQTLWTNAASGFYATGTHGTGSIPVTGAGTRLMWYPGKSAFRAGRIIGTEWDNVGNYSVAFGLGNTATGQWSAVSGGNGSSATNSYAVVSGGNGNTASGNTSAIGGGESNTATDYYAVVAGGRQNDATASQSAILGGAFNTASGAPSSILGGFFNTAAGDFSLAFGQYVNLSATADRSIGFGYSAVNTTIDLSDVFIIGTDPDNYPYKLGINTRSPEASLHLSGDALIDSVLTITNDSESDSLWFNVDVDTSYIDATNVIKIGGSSLIVEEDGDVTITGETNSDVLKSTGDLTLNFDGNDLVFSEAGSNITMQPDVSTFTLQTSLTDTRTTLNVNGSGNQNARFQMSYGSNPNGWMRWEQLSASTQFQFGTGIANYLFNSTSEDVDGIWRGDTDTNLLYIDAGNDRVGIGTNTPLAKFHVPGDVLFDSNLTITGNSGADSVWFNVTDDTTFVDATNVIKIGGNSLIVEENGDVTTTGALVAHQLRQEDSWHVFGGFQDQSEVIDVTAVDTWAFITNTTGDLWQAIDADGFTISSDTMTVVNDGHYTGNLSITFSGINGKDFKFRIYNVTQAVQMGYTIGATTTGASNYTNISIPFYLETNAGDELALEVQCNSDASDPTLIDAIFYIAYLHD